MESWKFLICVRTCVEGALRSDLLQVVEHTHDYTPPKYISLLFTDLGILTPAAVSDELIRQVVFYVRALLC